MKKSFSLIGLIVSMIALSFLTKQFFKLDRSLSSIPISGKTVFAFSVFTIITVFIFLLSTLGWNLILNLIVQKKVPFPDVLKINAKANIAKYIPGNFFHYAGRYYLARYFGINEQAVLLSSFVEAVMIVLSSLIFSSLALVKRTGPAITLLRRIFGINTVLVITSGIVILGLIIFFFLRKNKALVIDRLKKIATLPFMQIFGVCFLLHFLVFIISGMIMIGIIQVFLGIEVPLHLIPMIISAFSLSWLCGFLTYGSPAGIGVREAVLLVLIAPQIGKQPTLVAVLVFRITSILADLIVFLISLLFKTNTEGSTESD